MAEARWYHTATLLYDGRVLVTGGGNSVGDGMLSSAEIWDQVTGWSSAGDMSTAREDHTATLLPDGRVLVAGGRNIIGGESVILSSAEIYDPTLGPWTPTGSMTVERDMHNAVFLPSGGSSKVLMVGGDDPATAEFFYYPTP